MPPDCPSCHRPMTFEPEGEFLRALWECKPCGKAIPAQPEDAPRKPVAKTILDRACDVREADLVQAIKGEMERRGYLVLVVSQRGGLRSGTSKGCPDIWVACERRNKWVALEAKLRGGTVYPEQKALVDAGVSTLVYSVEDALRAVEA